MDWEKPKGVKDLAVQISRERDWFFWVVQKLTFRFSLAKLPSSEATWLCGGPLAGVPLGTLVLSRWGEPKIMIQIDPGTNSYGETMKRLGGRRRDWSVELEHETRFMISLHVFWAMFTL